MSDHRDDIDDSTLRSLLGALSQDAQAPEALRSRVLLRVARSMEQPAKPAVTLIRADQGEWRQCLPGVHMKVLHDDGVTRTFLARLDRGVHFPPHAHERDEECLVIEGTLVLDGITLHAGDYQVARAGSRHDDAYSPTGCVALLRSASPVRQSPAR